MKISGSTVLVTGANRGIGAEFVRQLRERGARKIYAGVRNVSTVTPTDGVEVIELDVTNQSQIAAAAALATDVSLVINNAGIVSVQPVVTGDIAQMRSEFETNVFGPLIVSRAFAPVLATNGGGAIINSLSALSWLSLQGWGAYSASKAALWSLTDGLRNELGAQGTQVLALHMGPVDTEMGAQVPLDRISPKVLVTAALDGLESGAVEILADDISRQVKAGLQFGPVERYAPFAG